MVEKEEVLDKVKALFVGGGRQGPCFRAGIIYGAIIGAAIGMLSTAATGYPLIWNVLLLAAIGIIAGGIIGFIYGWIPKTAANFFLVLLFIGALLFIWQSGFAAPIITEVEPISGELWGSVKDLGWCVTHLRECIAEPFYKGWGTEKKEEVISLRTSFETSHFYDDEKDAKLDIEIGVINKPEEGVEFFSIEPECYIDDKKMEISRLDGYKEDGKLTFLARATEQIASITCDVPASMIKDKKNVKARLNLIRPVKSSVTWTAITLSSDAIAELTTAGEKLPGEGSPKGKTVTYSGVPYSFGIGVRQSLPLTEGEHELRMEFIKVSGLSGTLKEIKELRISGKGETVYIDSCEGFSKKGDSFVLDEKVEKETSFVCLLEVDAEDKDNQYIIQADVEYDVEIEKEKGIPVFKEELVA